ncbi:hypothetical protein [Vibrio marisflavi]|uniref:Uncharacterized protein n=1 Tax=Vibrio marisflavi CECT 7928 TaxID=634439 RepID=A0ABN8E9C2_9VIBR|nr:hypothetical protein [Vibrio marisflavi]CAH0543373.1 hypothetical protein VMF7928_04516 [Vibrio marisflavi CECT 7928]
MNSKEKNKKEKKRRLEYEKRQAKRNIKDAKKLKKKNEEALAEELAAHTINHSAIPKGAVNWGKRGR